jgi:hypothetical protein
MLVLALMRRDRLAGTQHSKYRIFPPNYGIGELANNNNDNNKRSPVLKIENEAMKSCTMSCFNQNTSSNHRMWYGII